MPRKKSQYKLSREECAVLGRILPDYNVASLARDSNAMEIQVTLAVSEVCTLSEITDETVQDQVEKVSVCRTCLSHGVDI